MLFELNIDPSKENLADTYELMMSTCWKRRLYGEYKQCVVRLYHLMNAYGDMDDTDPQKGDLGLQAGIMVTYRDILKRRLQYINDSEPCDEEEDNGSV